jgi:hypothetical protein
MRTWSSWHLSLISFSVSNSLHFQECLSNHFLFVNHNKSVRMRMRQAQTKQKCNHTLLIFFCFSCFTLAVLALLATFLATVFCHHFLGFHDLFYVHWSVLLNLSSTKSLVHQRSYNFAESHRKKTFVVSVKKCMETVRSQPFFGFRI